MKTHGRLSDLHHDRCLSLAMWNGVADLERAHVRRHEVITFYRSFLAALADPIFRNGLTAGIGICFGLIRSPRTCQTGAAAEMAQGRAAGRRRNGFSCSGPAGAYSS
jgi:hypothetical protein